MSMDDGKRVILVFAGPNGSGKTTVMRGLPAFGTYVNADDLKREHGLTDLEAARQAESLRKAETLTGMMLSGIVSVWIGI